jgi:hypothetical protein
MLGIAARTIYRKLAAEEEAAQPAQSNEETK